MSKQAYLYRQLTVEGRTYHPGIHPAASLPMLDELLKNNYAIMMTRPVHVDRDEPEIEHVEAKVAEPKRRGRPRKGEYATRDMKAQ